MTTDEEKIDAALAWADKLKAVVVSTPGRDWRESHLAFFNELPAACQREAVILAAKKAEKENHNDE
jgi:hypothetical protein